MTDSAAPRPRTMSPIARAARSVEAGSPLRPPRSTCFRSACSRRGSATENSPAIWRRPSAPSPGRSNFLMPTRSGCSCSSTRAASSRARLRLDVIGPFEGQAGRSRAPASHLEAVWTRCRAIRAEDAAQAHLRSWTSGRGITIASIRASSRADDEEPCTITETTPDIDTKTPSTGRAITTLAKSLAPDRLPRARVYRRHWRACRKRKDRADAGSSAGGFRERVNLAVVTNDIFTREDGEFLVRHGRPCGRSDSRRWRPEAAPTRRSARTSRPTCSRSSA